MKHATNFVRASIAAVALSCSASAAWAFPQFTIEQAPLMGSGMAPYSGSAVKGDFLQGSYVEQLSGQWTSASGGNFQTAGLFSINQLRDTTAAQPDIFTYINYPEAGQSFPPPIGTIGAGLGYGLYALFEFSGTFSLNGTAISFTANPVGDVRIFADPLQNSVSTAVTKNINGFSFSGTPGPGCTGRGCDDLLLGSTTTVLTGDGSGGTGENKGSFAVVFGNLDLTPLGSSVFIEPNPFYLRMRTDGVFSQFLPNPQGPAACTSFPCDLVPGGVANILGTGSVTFAVPEPDVVGLLGLAAVGLFGVTSAAKRRKVQ